MTALQLADVLIAMAQAFEKRETSDRSSYDHYTIKFALIAGAEKCLEIATKETEL
jgi:hypothetical protein